MPERIFSMDEISLIWKRMPKSTFIHEEVRSVAGFKVLKDRVTVLLGGSVAGTVTTPGPSSMPLSMHFQCTAGAVRGDG